MLLEHERKDILGFPQRQNGRIPGRKIQVGTGNKKYILDQKQQIYQELSLCLWCTIISFLHIMVFTIVKGPPISWRCPKNSAGGGGGGGSYHEVPPL